MLELNSDQWYRACWLLALAAPLLSVSSAMFGGRLAYHRGYLTLGYALGLALGPLGFPLCLALPLKPSPLLATETDYLRRSGRPGLLAWGSGLLLGATAWPLLAYALLLLASGSGQLSSFDPVAASVQPLAGALSLTALLMLMLGAWLMAHWGLPRTALLYPLPDTGLADRLTLGANEVGELHELRWRLATGRDRLKGQYHFYSRSWPLAALLVLLSVIQFFLPGGTLALKIGLPLLAAAVIVNAARLRKHLPLATEQQLQLAEYALQELDRETRAPLGYHEHQRRPLLMELQEHLPVPLEHAVLLTRQCILELSERLDFYLQARERPELYEQDLPAVHSLERSPQRKAGMQAALQPSEPRPREHKWTPLLGISALVGAITFIRLLSETEKIWLQALFDPNAVVQREPPPLAALGGVLLLLALAVYLLVYQRRRS